MDEISANDAASILGVSSAQVRWYYRNGKLPGRRVGAQMLVFRRADVENFKKPVRTGRPPRKATAEASATQKNGRSKKK